MPRCLNVNVLIVFPLDPNSRLKRSFLSVFIPSIFMHHLHLHRFQPFPLPLFSLLHSCPNLIAIPALGADRYQAILVANDAVYSSQFPAIRLSRLFSFFFMRKHLSWLFGLFLPVRTYEAMAAMLHDFYHFLPPPSVLARMGVPSAICCTYKVRR